MKERRPIFPYVSTEAHRVQQHLHIRVNWVPEGFDGSAFVWMGPQVVIKDEESQLVCGSPQTR